MKTNMKLVRPTNDPGATDTATVDEAHRLSVVRDALADIAALIAEYGDVKLRSMVAEHIGEAVMSLSDLERVQILRGEAQ